MFVCGARSIRAGWAFSEVATREVPMRVRSAYLVVGAPVKPALDIVEAGVVRCQVCKC